MSYSKSKHASCKKTSPPLLEKMPTDPEKAIEWLGGLRFNEFDAVCCAAVTTFLVDGEPVPVRAINLMASTMRDRYRREIQKAKDGSRATDGSRFRS